MQRRWLQRCRTPKSRAAKPGHRDAVQLLDQTSAEEKKTDDVLGQLAQSAVNAAAA
jgi:ferritin-like metal-binding protein YciE